MPGFYRSKAEKIKQLQQQASYCLHQASKEMDKGLDMRLDILRKYLSQLLQYQQHPCHKHLSQYMQARIEEMRFVLSSQTAAQEYDSDTEDDERIYEERLTTGPDPQTLLSSVVMQIPSQKDIDSMEHMVAGIPEEDQATRIGNMTRLLDQFPTLPTVTTDASPLSRNWTDLFRAIDRETMSTALYLFSKIPSDDAILKPLLAVHTRGYLKKLIEYSSKARKTGSFEQDSDVIVTPKTFELLIRDLATTLFRSEKICFSFGLPSHHAYGNTANGFCFINKTAVLMQHMANNSPDPVHFVIAGLDVNRDDGLCDVLRCKLSELDACHIDVFDSRVYPMHNTAMISKEFNERIRPGEPPSSKWQRNNYTYHALDLSLEKSQRQRLFSEQPRQHPAVQQVLATVHNQIQKAIEEGKKIAILLPTGWDSHCDETAACGKMVDGSPLSAEEAGLCRFTDRDFDFFHSSILSFLNTYKEHISHFYWGLEGGYDTSMYQRQTRNLLKLISMQLAPQAQALPSSSSSSTLEDDDFTDSRPSSSGYRG